MPAGVAELTGAAQGVQVKRDELDAWCNDPHFDRTIQGTFVRVLMDEESQSRKYAIGKVLRVVQAQNPYHFGNLTRTSKELELEFGNQKGNFQMNTVSNSLISNAEFQTWWTNVQNGSNPTNGDLLLQNMRATKLSLHQFRERFQAAPPQRTQPPPQNPEAVQGTVFKQPSPPKGGATFSSGGINSDDIVSELRAELAKLKEQTNLFPAQPAFAAMTTHDLQTLEARVESYRAQVREAIEERRKCIVCYEKPANVIFMPCRHQCACEDCSMKLKECPMCRGPINDRIKPFGT